MVRLLVTRPEPDASETAARLRALDIDAVVSPLLQARMLTTTLPPAPGFAALAITSANALRALLAALDGSCRTAIGVVSHIAEKTIGLRGQILSPDGRIAIEARHAGPAAAPDAVGHELGQILRDKAGSDFLKLFPG